MKWRLLFAVITALPAMAQVSNNDIQDRVTLPLNKSIQSSTSGADVQWKCINKALTNKCLVYHNDQWFTFTVDQPGDYYINIASQTCRDSKGVQMIVIEGNPCETSTYRILECIPQIRTEDVFIHLSKLKPRIAYLINIDGFLGDHCEFDIELSDRPKGLPRVPVNLDTLNVSSRLESKVVYMEWAVGQDLANGLYAFRIFKQKGQNSLDLVEEINLRRSNAIGSPADTYQFVDTLRVPGVYNYEIYGVRESDDMPLLLSQNKFNYYEKQVIAEQRPAVKVLSVRMGFPARERFQLRLYNYDGDQLLWTHDGESQGEGELFMIDPQPYAQSGLRKFQLLVLDKEGNKVDEIYFRVDHNGNVLKD